MTDPVGQPAGAWDLVFTEEFAGPMVAVDAAAGFYRLSPGGPTWRVWYPDFPHYLAQPAGAHQNNVGTADVYYDATGVAVSGGLLTLTARPVSTFSGLRLTSGMIQSYPTFTPTYGYAEARLKLPDASQSWPAFWMVGAADYSVNSSEFDVVEAFGEGPGFYRISTWRNGTGGQPGTLAGQQVTATITDWHTYGADWSPQGLRFYLDGNLVAVDTTPADIPVAPMHLLLNLSVMGNADLTQYPAALQAEYVRYWQRPIGGEARVGDETVTAMYLGETPVSLL